VSDLASDQKDKLTGVHFDRLLNEYKQLGGELSADRKSFTFYSYETGNHAVVVSPFVYKIKFGLGDLKYSSNGETFTNDVAPFISGEGRMVVPTRAVSEALWASVTWNEATETATITTDGKEVSVKMGEPLPNGLGTPVMSQNRTFVPIRYISETLGANVIWDQDSKTVYIYK
jgi:hypothetical protein